MAAAFGMSVVHKEALIVNRVELVHRMIVDDVFISSLLQNKMLVFSQQEELQEVNKIRHKGASWVLDFMPKKGPKAMAAFVEALMVTQQGDLADMVAKDLADKWRSEHPEEVDTDSDDPDLHVPPISVPVTTPSNVDGAAREIVLTENPDIHIDVQSSPSPFVQKIEKDPISYAIKRKGMAVIINVERFHGKTPRGVRLGMRFGTDVDVRNASRLFDRLGYTVEDWSGCNYQDLKERLQQCASSDRHKDADSFVMVVLSHGFNGGFYTADSKEMLMKDVVSHFMSARCPSLRDKPKMFFVQACQGSDKTEGVEVPTETPDDDTEATETPNDNTVPTKKPSDDTIPTGKPNDDPVDQVTQDLQRLGLSEDDVTDESTLHGIIGDEKDFFIAFSTVPKYVSIRHESKGTWFVRDLVTVLGHRAHDTSLQDMMREVTHLVSQRRSIRRVTQKNPDTGKMEEVLSKYVQICNTLDSIPKSVYFLPGIKG